MVSRPRLSLPKRLLRHRSGQSQQQGPEEAVDDNADAATSPFQAAAQPGQEPLGRVRVQVYAGRDILASDRSGTSDPFLRLSAGGQDRVQSDIISKTLNPVWGELPHGFKAVPEAKAGHRSAVLEFETYKDTLAQQNIEIVLWDKDRFSKNDYLGELNLPIDVWFPALKTGAVLFDNPDNPPSWHSIASTRSRTEASGAMLVKVGFINTSQKVSGEAEMAATVAEAVAFKHHHSGRLSRTERVLTAPPMESVGTVQKRDHPISGDAMENLAYQYELPGDSTSSESDAEDDEDDVSEFSTESEQRHFEPAPDTPDGPPSAYFDTNDQIPDLVISKHGLSDEPQDVDTPKLPPEPETPAATAAAAPPSKGRKFGLPLFKRSNSTRSTASDVASLSATGFASSESIAANTPAAETKRRGFRKSKHKSGSSPEQLTSEPVPSSTKQKKKRRTGKSHSYEFSNSDVVGVCFLEVQAASDLPRWKDATRLTFDMDPFVVISFGKKVFRTRVLRHTLNPKWDERLFFHVRQHEVGYNLQASVYDWDRVSSNDFVGRASTDLEFLFHKAPVAQDNGLYMCDKKGFLLKDEFQEWEAPLIIPNSPDREHSRHPKIKLRAKYVPYEALRQQFWRQYLQDFDADGNGQFSDVELFAMLDSLGSTLSSETLENFFTRFNKSRDSESLTYDEVVACLESELSRSEHKIKPRTLSGSTTPGDVPSLSDNVDGIGYTGNHSGDPDRNKHLAPFAKPTAPDMSARDEVVASSSSSSSVSEDPTPPSLKEERVINIKECPLCHKPRLNKRSEIDIITHLAICASQDWSHMGSLMVSNFVTSEQAHRKWLGKAISRMTKGAYQLGADSGNILVQNRMTGQLLEEKMQIYVRLGIRLGYRGMTGTVEGGRVRRLFASMSVKQGLKYDSPESAEEIAPFIAFHGLDMGEVKDPLESFKTFNEFFYRKLKDGARPVAEPSDPRVLVSAADCRLMAFQTIDEATKIWIKGKDFSVARMLGDMYGKEAKKYEGGSLLIFRLAPADYHRYHSPVDGTVGHFDKISGLYYTVNPMAIRSQVDVYGENKREVSPIDSPSFGRVMMVYIGAMLVAGITQSVQEGETVRRGDEIGYFSFGGSTIVALFEPGKVQFDEDILYNSSKSIETLVRVGMRIGRVPAEA